jgi:agmatinase
LGVGDKSNPAERAKIAVIPFGFEHSVSYGGGTAKGPMAMIKASHQVELFDEELWCESYRKFGVATVKTPPVKKTVAAALTQLADLTSSVLDGGKFPFIFGGEHSITAGAIRPFALRHKNLTIVHFDAHADLRDGYDGEHFSHAAALRRCLDQPGHEHIKLVSIGIRNISAGEVPFLDKNKKRISIFWAKDKGATASSTSFLSSPRKRGSTNKHPMDSRFRGNDSGWEVMDIINAVGKGPVYITFDIDAFDASMIPATGTPEPGGLFWDETMAILRAVTQHNKILGADIVELAPKPNLHACDFMAAKLAYKMMGYVFS